MAASTQNTSPQALYVRIFIVLRIFKLNWVLILCLGLIAFNSQAQQLPLKIERFGLENGYPTAPVTFPIVQDEDGFIWFGSWSGLYKYDGYTFKGGRAAMPRPEKREKHFTSLV